MASSGSASEDFQSRVDRIFGSLAFSGSPTPASWSLSDTEVEKREWKRDQLSSYDREEMPSVASFDELSGQQRIATEGMRASMGLDRTLDDEAEEDEYDKVALGKEDAGEDGLSMFIGRIRDPRANYHAAKIRLKEDQLEAKGVTGSQQSSKPVPPKPILKRKETSSDPEARPSKRVSFHSVAE